MCGALHAHIGFRVLVATRYNLSALINVWPTEVNAVAVRRTIVRNAVGLPPSCMKAVRESVQGAFVQGHSCLSTLQAGTITFEARQSARSCSTLSGTVCMLYLCTETVARTLAATLRNGGR
ncbi:hypothetical protein POSPLADRAFT_1040359 [Postia placenta MAD-698-R-SB12]|uniref:Uncharacterized protein n=1 Tax=Postia placenta MAD-698-R-SB12 TaxID=670580 RepID=A0A1X6MXZ9_9APHY|nr:hypothetical protein POSPLADRAFT_1040359 [Postia placenta MAD-698-R-SB12]OSX61122.1 hypothetical protein POSPLADRAFT_1040359 [Postia placenta MAD-698-R-SB12]